MHLSLFDVILMVADIKEAFLKCFIFSNFSFLNFISKPWRGVRGEKSPIFWFVPKVHKITRAKPSLCLELGA